MLAKARTDAERLRIALVNMLVNARHAVNGDQAAEIPPVPQSSTAPLITLRSRATGGRVQITIADRGAGISGPDVAQIFEPYFTTKRGGTGLGLPIAKNIVEGLGGTIAVSSTLGQGTEIVIDLPFNAPLAAVSSRGGALAPGGPVRS